MTNKQTKFIYISLFLIFIASPIFSELKLVRSSYSPVAKPIVIEKETPEFDVTNVSVQSVKVNPEFTKEVSTAYSIKQFILFGIGALGLVLALILIRDVLFMSKGAFSGSRLRRLPAPLFTIANFISHNVLRRKKQTTYSSIDDYKS